MAQSETIHCQLMVIGAGMAGMAAALFAARRHVSTVQVGLSAEIIYASGLIDLLGIHPIEKGFQVFDAVPDIQQPLIIQISRDTRTAEGSLAGTFPDPAAQADRFEVRPGALIADALYDAVDRALRYHFAVAQDNVVGVAILQPKPRRQTRLGPAPVGCHRQRFGLRPTGTRCAESTADEIGRLFGHQTVCGQFSAGNGGKIVNAFRCVIDQSKSAADATIIFCGRCIEQRPYAGISANEAGVF